MKLTWTFYIKDDQGNSESVTLTVIYVPELDELKLDKGGFLDTQNNQAFVDWSTYKRFDKADVAERRDAYLRLTVLAKSEGVIIEGKRIGFQNYVQ